MPSEIEEIDEDLLPRYDNRHNDSTLENDKYNSNSNSNINDNRDGEINCTSNAERETDKKIEEDGRKGTSTRGLRWGGLTPRKSENSSSKKKEENVDIKSEDGGHFPHKLKLDALLPDNFPEDQFKEEFCPVDGWACLKEDRTLEPENPEKIKILVNVNMVSLNFKLELFSKMKNVEVLYLGRKQRWDREHHHIDVKNSEFLKGLKNMEKLNVLSLQGISGIQELPSSISNLKSLEILDLRACYNLEKLPKEIGSLKKLTHLDISECYLLDCMPRELLSLSELQVLKGFVITDTKNKSFCTLDELSGLKKLRKLSVNLNSVTFSVDKFSVVLKFKSLLKLKITWGGKISRVEQNKKSKQENNKAKSEDLRRQKSLVEEVKSSVPELEKLELQCLPHKTLPNWVTPVNLKSLKKLYIRGGGLQSLGEIGNQQWKVEVLRLKYLLQLKINWRELMIMFPELQYVEKFKCPKVTLFPCDCYGVWVKSPEEKPVELPQSTS